LLCVALALTLAGLGGCQHFRKPAGGPDVPAPEAGARLGAREVADVQIALARYSLEPRGQGAQALAAYREALKQDPSRADAALRAALLLDQQGKFAESAEFYRKAQEAQPDNADVGCNLGYSLYLQRRYDEAETVLRKALSQQPGHARAHTNLGLVLGQTGRPIEALAEFRRAGCGEADAHVNLAFALTLREAWPEARAHYERALVCDPSCVAARKGLKEVAVMSDRVARLTADPPAEDGAALLREPDTAQTPPVAARMDGGTPE
jgi:Tfp pilus assembly protein PilF